MNYIYIIIAWFILSAFWGGLGVAIGPGIMMLLVGLIIGVSGFTYSLCEKVFDYQLKLAVAGLVIFITSFVITMVFFPTLSLTISGYIFLALFILIPSYLILFIVEKLAAKF